MTSLRNIDIKEFSDEVRYRREEALSVIGTMCVENYREALRLVCRDDNWKIAHPAQSEPAFTMPTFDDLYNGFWSGAQKVGFEVRATDAQCKLLAKLALAAGEMHISAEPLTKRSASALINDYQR